MNKKTIISISVFLIFLILISSGCKRIRDKKLEQSNNEFETTEIEMKDNLESGNNKSEQNNKESEITETKTTNILKSGDYKFIIKQGNTERYYLLHVPKAYNGSQTQLILAFHGGMGTAETMKENYDWIEKSDKEGFVVAFPNGASRLPSGKIATWNAGRCCGYAVESDSDDIGFIKLVIDDIKKKIKIDKVFATGMSNGGMLSHRLACEMPDVFAAIAAVAGTNNYDACNPPKPISVMHIHGLKDDHVLFNGGCGPGCQRFSETDFTSVPETMSKWVERNNCNDNSERVFENDNGYCDLYSGCDDNVQVKLCVAKDGGHSWPGIELSSNALEKSVPSQSFSATDEIWDFFKTK